MKRILFLTAAVVLSAQVFAQCDGRYESEIFDDVQVTEVEYTDVYDWSLFNSGLDMDIYEPVGDIETNRPLIIFAHGGTFYLGDKDNPAMISLCESFAKRGYVTASIQYRLTTVWNLTDSMHMLQTVFNAIGDAKSAIRYFRKDVAENGNQFGIDPHQIYMGGYSAGAIIAANLAFIDDINELPSYLVSIAENAGGIDGNSGNEGYSSSVKGVVSLAGAVYKPSFIDPDDEPIVSLHATDDNTVDYNCGHPLSNNSLLPKLCGSGIVHEKANENNLYNDLLTFTSGDHAAPLNYDVSVPFISDFLYTTLDCYEVSAAIEEQRLTIQVYPNPSSSYVSLKLNMPIRVLNLFDLTGKKVKVIQSAINSHEMMLDVRDVSAGVYVLSVETEQGVVRERLMIQ
tara:strand:- start:6271 stop:7467 length:1197 start_codon:yes stop_codon:yes gene_type:complete